MCLASAACCCASSLCSMANCCGNSKMGARAGRVVYTVLYFFAGLLALLLKYFGHYLFVDLVVFKIGCVDPTNTTAPAGSSDYFVPCAGAQAVYRISLGLVSFFVACGIISGVLKQFHSGWWIIKVFLYAAALIYPFFVDWDMDAYSKASRGFAGCFLVFQMLTYIACAYNLQEGIMEKSEAFTEDQSNNGTSCSQCNCVNCWTILYLFLCVAGLGGIVTGLVLMYINFPCVLPSVMTSITLLIAVAVVSFCVWTKFNRGLLTGVVIACYSTYLCWSALTSNPDKTVLLIDGVNKSCNPFLCDPTDPDSQCDAGTMVIGILFTILAVSYAGYALGDSAATEDKDADTALLKNRKRKGSYDSADGSDKFEPRTRDLEKDGSVSKQAKLDWEEEVKDEAEAERDSRNEGASKCCGCGVSDNVRNVLFQLVMALASFYLAMLLTNWAVFDSSGTNAAGVGEASMWIKFVSQWCTVALFVWTLLAPLCCPGRTFD